MRDNIKDLVVYRPWDKFDELRLLIHPGCTHPGNRNLVHRIEDWTEHLISQLHNATKI